MSTIYDNMGNADLLDGGLSIPLRQQSAPNADDNAEENLKPFMDANSVDANIELSAYQDRSLHALELVDDIVLKNYISKLSELEVVPCANPNTNEIILFKINKMVYEKDEYATDKFISVVSAMTYTNSSIYLIVDGHESHTDFYLGIKSEDEKRQKSTIAETFKNSLLGQFPGADIEDYSYVVKDAEHSKQDVLLHRITEAVCVSSCVGIPSYKNSKGEYTNANFIQGIEKFAYAMQGKNYTAVVLATNMPKQEIDKLRNGYETVYTELSAMATRQLAYSTNESLANAISRTKGSSDTHTTSVAEGISTAETHTDSEATSTAHGTSHTEGEAKENGWGKASKAVAGVGGAAAGIGGAIAGVGVALTATGIGSVVGVPLMAGGALIGGAGAVVGGVGSLLGIGAKNKSKSDTETITETESFTSSDGITHTKSTTTTVSDAHTDSFSETNGETSTIGSSKNFTITIQNKHIIEVQKRIDKQLERIEMFESTGLWSTGAYFMSYDTDRSVAEICATVFRSIMQGDQSGVETSALNTWYNGNPAFPSLIQYVSTLSHPLFKYDDKVLGSKMTLPSTSLLSSKELSIMIGLPRKSVPGFPVIEHVSLGKEVVRHTVCSKSNSSFEFGCIFDQGIDKENNKVSLDLNSLTQHTFITGSTGCGKSEAVYKLIETIGNTKAKFLIIEPAKGEYKKVFGTARVFGTNPFLTELLKINPFQFAEGVHVLEHTDRLVEILNVCWPMYAAMPAVLKEAVLNAYENCGWDLFKSKNKYSNRIFPTFSDLIWELENVIATSSYSEEVKSNYKGSLVTRVKSLTNGIYGEIFSGKEIGDHILFDENVIVDISRIGSQETKSLIMGVLIMRLNEYRVTSNIEANSDLRHITILEEAHNILKCCSQEQNLEGSNVAGKSVEMISNAIAEMRTYGEGFIIVDQSPSAVDISAIRNTNTKIIMRLPEESDRIIAGKSAAMKDNQLDEIAKLPTGVAVIYQNDWEEPVLCHVDMYKGNRTSFSYISKDDALVVSPVITESIKFMMQEKVSIPVQFDLNLIKDNLFSTSLPTFVKLNIYKAIQEFEETGTASIWKNHQFEKFSLVISGIFDSKQNVLHIVKTSHDFDELTNNLKEYIHNKVNDVPNELELSICQSLMRAYSIENETCLKVYSAWLKNTKSKLAP